MVDKEPLAYRGTRVDFDTRQKASEVGHEPRHHVSLSAIEPVRDLVEQDRVEPGIRE